MASPGGALVFDDWHEVPLKSTLHELIVTGLSRAPEGTTVFFLSRRGPPPAFARLRVNNRLALLGWESLRLTRAECEGIARLRRTRRPSGEGIIRGQSIPIMPGSGFGSETATITGTIWLP